MKLPTILAYHPDLAENMPVKTFPDGILICKNAAVCILPQLLCPTMVGLTEKIFIQDISCVDFNYCQFYENWRRIEH